MIDIKACSREKHYSALRDFKAIVFINCAYGVHFGGWTPCHDSSTLFCILLGEQNKLDSLGTALQLQYEKRRKL